MMRSSDNEILARVDQGAPIGEVMRRYWHSICTVDELLSRTAIPSGANFWGTTSSCSATQLAQSAC
jgi:hypothetical protein